MNRTVITCTLALLGLLSAACSSTPPCPEGYTYDEDLRICVFTGDAGMEEPPPDEEDAGQDEEDAGQDEDAGEETDAGEESDAGEETDAGDTDAGDTDAG